MFSTALGVLIGVIHLLGYWIYYKGSHSKENPIRPEPMSWLIWAFGSFVNLASYSLLSGDMVKDILPLVCSLACVYIFVDQWIQRGKKLEKMTKEGISMFSLDAGSMFIGFITRSALVANICCQIGTVASFIPMLRATAKDPTREKPLPWIIWSIAYGLDVILVISRWEKWGDVVYPATCLVLHVLMVVIINRGKAK
jgi:hypothetical protein